MINKLKSWKGTIEINGTKYNSIKEVQEKFNAGEPVCIKLYPKEKVEESVKTGEIKITVKKYMTEKSNPDFDFMQKWNDDIPMPLRTMQGTVEKETRGMVYMHLHGVTSDSEVHCMRCGKKLTNPVSMKYGIGPECLAKIGFMGDIEDVPDIKKKVHEVTWDGWVIKSAIIRKEEM